MQANDDMRKHSFRGKKTECCSGADTFILCKSKKFRHQ